MRIVRIKNFIVDTQKGIFDAEKKETVFDPNKKTTKDFSNNTWGVLKLLIDNALSNGKGCTVDSFKNIFPDMVDKKVWVQKQISYIRKTLGDRDVVIHNKGNMTYYLDKNSVELCAVSESADMKNYIYDIINMPEENKRELLYRSTIVIHYLCEEAEELKECFDEDKNILKAVEASFVRQKTSDGRFVTSNNSKKNGERINAIAEAALAKHKEQGYSELKRCVLFAVLNDADSEFINAVKQRQPDAIDRICKKLFPDQPAGGYDLNF